MEQQAYTVVDVAVQNLHPHPKNERYKTPLPDDSDEFRLMKVSIELDGLRNPLLVQSGTNIIISGHTRWRIASQLGWTSVPVRYLDVDDDAAELMLVADNVERAGKERDLMRLARSIDRLYLRYSSRREAYDHLAGVFSVADRQLDRLRSLVKLVPALQDFVSDGRIALKAGSTLAALSEDEQNAAVQFIVDSGLTKEKEWRFTEKQVGYFIDHLRRKQLGLIEPTLPIAEIDHQVEETGEPLVVVQQDILGENMESDEANEEKPEGVNRIEQVEPDLSAPHHYEGRRDVHVEHLDPPDERSAITEKDEKNAKNEHAIYTAVKLVTRDIRALERMKSQTLPAVELAMQLGSSEVKIEINALKKNLREMADAL